MGTVRTSPAPRPPGPTMSLQRKRKLGRRLAYRIVLHELFRAGEHESRGGLLRDLSQLFDLDPSQCQRMADAERAGDQGRPARPFDPMRTFRLAFMVALESGAISVQERKILKRMAACLQLTREQQMEAVADLRQPGTLIKPPEQSAQSPAYPEFADLEGPSMESMEIPQLDDDPGDENYPFDTPEAVSPEETEPPVSPPSPKSMSREERKRRSVERRKERLSRKRNKAAPTVPMPGPVEAPAAGVTAKKTRIGSAGPTVTSPAVPGKSPLIPAVICAVLVAGLGSWYLLSSPASDVSPEPVDARSASVEPEPPRKEPAAARKPDPPAGARNSRVVRPLAERLRSIQARAAEVREAELSQLLTPAGSLATAAANRPAYLVRIAAIGSSHAKARRGLSRIARDRSDPLRLSAVLALSRLKAAGVSEIAETLSRSSLDMERRIGLLALSRLSGNRKRWARELASIRRTWPLARFLSDAGDPAALELLEWELGSEAASQREKALGLLARGFGGTTGSLGDYRVVDAVLARLADPDAAVRSAALDCLAQIGDRSVTPLALRALSNPRPAERRGALRLLASLSDSEAVAAVMKALSDPDGGVSSFAALTLSEFDHLPVEFLAGQIRSLPQDSPVREAVVTALFRTDRIGFLDAIWDLLSHLTRKEMRLASRCLIELSRHQMVREQIRQGLSEKVRILSGFHRSEVVRTLGQVSSSPVDGPEGDPELVKLLGSGDPDQAIEASRKLAALYGNQMIDELAVLALSPNRRVRRHGCTMLAELAGREDAPLLQAISERVGPELVPVLIRGQARLGFTSGLDRLVGQLGGKGTGSLARARRRIAAWGLARIGVPGGVPPLLASLEDPSWPVRTVAAWGLNRYLSLGLIGGDDGRRVRLVLAGLITDPRLEVQWAARGR